MKILSPEWRRRAMHHQHIDGGAAVPDGMQIDLWVFNHNPLAEAVGDDEIKRTTAVLTVAQGDRHVATVANAAMVKPELMGYLVEKLIEQLVAQEPEPVPDLLKNLRASLHVRKG